MESEAVANDLTSVNILLQKQSIWETTVMAKTRQIQDLKEQAEHLSRISPEKEEEIMQSTDAVAQNFAKIKGKYLYTYIYLKKFHTYPHCKFQRLFLFLSLLHKNLMHNIFFPSIFGRWGKIENAF
jgi:hypothetical protein